MNTTTQQTGQSGSDYTDIIYTVKDLVATIAINRPKKLNAFSLQTIKEIGSALNRSAADRNVGVIVLTGVGEKAFSSGGDMAMGAGGLEEGDWYLGRHLVDCPKPVIARVSGYAMGGGNHLAYCCDFTIAADHSTFGQTGPRVGSPAGGYFVSHAASILGHKRAREMWMLCRRYTAKQALEWGLINAAVPQAELDAEVSRWCTDLLSLSPTVLRIVKASFRVHMEHYMGRNVSDMVRLLAPNYFETGEQNEGATAFLAKRRPDFSPWR